MSLPGPVPSPASDDRTELALLESARANDDRACETLVRQHSGHLLAVARRLLRNEDDARDAVQDAFLAAFRSLDRFTGASRLSTWLHRIVVNVCLMKLRTRRRKPEEAIDELLPTFQPDGYHTATLVDWSQNALEELERKETCALVRRCIDRLPESYRTVLLLRDIEELELAEIAKMLDITPNAVKIRVHRARQALRTLLDPHFKRGDR